MGRFNEKIACAFLIFVIALPTICGSCFSSFSGGGGESNCGLTTTKGLKCWGDGFYGQLGYQTAIDIGTSPSQVKFSIYHFFRIILIAW